MSNMKFPSWYAELKNDLENMSQALTKKLTGWQCMPLTTFTFSRRKPIISPILSRFTPATTVGTRVTASPAFSQLRMACFFISKSGSPLSAIYISSFVPSNCMNTTEAPAFFSSAAYPSSRASFLPLVFIWIYSKPLSFAFLIQSYQEGFFLFYRFAHKNQ